MAISLTSEAAEHVSRQLVSRGKGEGIRIGVKTSGCSGLAYVLEFVDQVEPEVVLWDRHGRWLEDGVNQVHDAVAGQEAVSYTHLTLPTMLWV